MHEYSVVTALLAQVTHQARLRRARQVTRVRIRLGELAGVDASLLETAFSMVSQADVLYRAAELEIATVARTWSCPRCSHAFEANARLWCPACDLPARLVSGDEIILDQIEMELDDV